MLETKKQLESLGITVRRTLRNPPPAQLYEYSILHEHGAVTATGALATSSGEKTGRSPRDKRIVAHPQSSGDIWWGEVNMKIDEDTFMLNRQRAVDYLNTRDLLYVIDGYAGWDPKYRIKIRVICERAYHALFVHNMLVRPSMADLAVFGEPDYVIYNAGKFPADPEISPSIGSRTSVNISFERGELVILGTQYAGEMKKGVFTMINYLMPRQGVLPMHCSANEGARGDVSLLFGLSESGKTALATDRTRMLIGDDEHCWTGDGIFNIEGGCYAKSVHLSADHQPEIYGAIRFGTVLENAVYDDRTRQVDYRDASLTENIRASYPLEFIPNAKFPSVGGHPKHIILFACDAFGVLPPVSRLTPAQATYYFISGYTTNMEGMEAGSVEPLPYFSACFGAEFLVWHPTRYAEMLAERMRRHGARAWLVNTGGLGGPPGTGRRLPIEYTRAVVDAIHAGALDDCPAAVDPNFGLEVPAACPGVPPELLAPKQNWPDPEAYDREAKRLCEWFRKHFAKYEVAAGREIRDAGPRG